MSKTTKSRKQKRELTKQEQERAREWYAALGNLTGEARWRWFKSVIQDAFDEVLSKNNGDETAARKQIRAAILDLDRCSNRYDAELAFLALSELAHRLAIAYTVAADTPFPQELPTAPSLVQ